MGMGRAVAAATAMMIAAPALAQTEAAPVAEAAPVPPAGAAPTFRTPERDAAGYVTPNRSLSAEETTWHVRVALNVAALGCRDAQVEATTAAYNAILTTDREPLAQAASAVERLYRARHGAAWQAAQDDAMTRLYNFFAQPPAHDAFCAEAQAVLRESATVAPANFAPFAAAALPRLEAPFLAFFEAYDGYRRDLAGWQARHPAPLPSVVIATAAVPTVGGAATVAADPVIVPPPVVPTLPVALAAVSAPAASPAALSYRGPVGP